VGGWVVLSVLFVFTVGSLDCLAEGLWGCCGHPHIQSKKQLFNQPRQATQPNQTKRPTNQPINPISRPSQKIKATNLAK